MKACLSMIVLFVLSPALLASDFESEEGLITIEINHDDGGKTSKRHRQKLLSALAREGCDAISFSETDEPYPQLVFESAPITEVAETRSDYRLISRATTLDGELTVKGAILVFAARGIRDLSDLKGEWVSFVGKDSWAGYRLPIALLNKAGINENTNEFYFVGNHVGSVSALLHKDVLVAVVAEPLAQRWAEPNQLSIVAVTDEVATGGWWIHKRVSKNRIKRCVQALTQVKRSELTTLPAWIGGFIAAEE